MSDEQASAPEQQLATAPESAAPESASAHPRPVTPEQRRHLRRILACFLLVVVLLPLTGLGDAWGWLLVPMVLAAAVGMREAIRLRRTVTRSGSR